MKRFEFSLDRLLTIKRQLERLAELEQQRAADALGRAREKVRGLRAQVARISEQFAAAVGSAMTPHQWGSASDMTERLGESIRVAEGEAADAERRLAAAAQERAQLATEAEALATLRRQQWDQWRLEAQKADQDRLDELGLRRWQAARDEDAAGPQAPA